MLAPSGLRIADAAPGVKHAEFGIHQIRVRRERADLHARLFDHCLDFRRVLVEARHVAITAVGNQTATHEKTRLDIFKTELRGTFDAVRQAFIDMPDELHVHADVNFFLARICGSGT